MKDEVELFFEKWSLNRKRRRNFLLEQLKLAAVKLVESDVAKMKVSYKGNDDIGHVGEVEFISPLGEVIYIDERDFDMYLVNPDSDFTVNIKNLILEVVYTVIPSGWEINDGSSGSVTVDLTLKSVRVVHSWTQQIEETYSYQYANV